jgi:hypothetical protein
LNGRKVVNTGNTNMDTSGGMGETTQPFATSPLPEFLERHKNSKNYYYVKYLHKQL